MNREENLLTRLQNINLAFHFEVEQQLNSVFLIFFLSSMEKLVCGGSRENHR